MFSESISDFSSDKNELYLLYDRLKKSGVNVIDLISGNPTHFGINFPKEVLSKSILAYIKGFRSYKPDPKGLLPARKAIAEYYLSEDYLVGSENIILTPGTSESYFYIFKLLANEGSKILCPRPSYPLFEFIAKIAGVTLAYYDLSEEHNWQIDFKSLEYGINSNTAAVVVISPHNPTGHVCSSQEIRNISAICKRHSLPLIVDEVFCEFIFSKTKYPRFIGGEPPIVFTLNGASKMFSLPQLKLGWVAVSGKNNLVKQAISRLEVIADTFLASSEYSQSILPELFRQGKKFVTNYRREIRERLLTAEKVLNNSPLKINKPPDGGFYLVSEIPETYKKSSFDFTVGLLREKHVLTHPASFYDFRTDGFLVSSIIPQNETLTKGYRKIVDFLSKR